MLIRLLFAVGIAAGAHEIGTTRVKVVFPADGTYAVEIETDAAPLMEKLAARTGRTGSLESYDEAFRGGLGLAFDGVETRPAIAYSLLADTGVQVRLTGSL